jgi:DNA-binding MarR family transcriptional regulator
VCRHHALTAPGPPPARVLDGPCGFAWAIYIVNVPLKISATRNAKVASDPEAAEPAESAAPSDRAGLAEEVIREITSWNPREFIVAFRRWHRSELSLVHLNVLTFLDVLGPMSMGKLAETLDVSVASATGIVTRMEARGLVERRHGPDDRRVVTVHVTEGGLDVFRDIDERRREGLRALLAGLTESELRGLLVGHRALRAQRGAAALSPAAAASRSATTGTLGPTPTPTPTKKF